jgi:hypothetical protein
MDREVTMSAVTDGRQGPQAERDPGHAQVERAAAGKTVEGADERSALDYLLGAPEPARYKVTVGYETPAGLKDLRFEFVAIDGRKIDKIELKHIDDRTGQMDKTAADMELVIEACDAIIDVETGKAVKPSSEEFRRVKPDLPPLASSIDALEARFGTQTGLIAGVARAIREANGWNADRVGKASRVLVAAAGN